jgi:hypothetical protein
MKTKITTEDLKMLAEGMGLEPEMIGTIKPKMRVLLNSDFPIWEPHENAKQAIEVLEHFKISCVWIGNNTIEAWIEKHYSRSIQCKDWKTAVVLAAIKYIKNK